MHFMRPRCWCSAITWTIRLFNRRSANSGDLLVFVGELFESKESKSNRVMRYADSSRESVHRICALGQTLDQMATIDFSLAVVSWFESSYAGGQLDFRRGNEGAAQRRLQVLQSSLSCWVLCFWKCSTKQLPFTVRMLWKASGLLCSVI